MGRWMSWGLLQLMLTAAWVGATPSADAQELRFGIVPGLSEAETRAEFEPLMVYLSNTLGRRVGLSMAKDHADLRAQIETGALDIGSFSPVAYLAAIRGGRIRCIAQSMLGGSTTYRGLVIKRFDSGINSVADLAGTRLAFVDPESASGYLYPWAMFIEQGIDPARYFKETIFAGTHEQVIAAVLFGLVQAGATDEGAVALAKAKGLPTFDLEVLATTAPIPHDAVAVRVGLDEPLVRKIQMALLELNTSLAGRPVIAGQQRKLTGYAPPDDRLYDTVRRAMKKGGL